MGVEHAIHVQWERHEVDDGPGPGLEAGHQGVQVGALALHATNAFTVSFRGEDLIEGSAHLAFLFVGERLKLAIRRLVDIQVFNF
jgi:hypothetical protein